MTAPSQPLDRPLPHDVAAGESAFIQYYQKYAVFSWPWAWRRTVMFGGISLLAAASYGASHGLMVRSVWEAVVVGSAVALSNIVLIGAGPLLAALVRHSGWPKRAQHVFIVAAVILGTVLGALIYIWSESVHDGFMDAHGMGVPAAPAPVADIHWVLRRMLAAGQNLFVLFIASGGLALPSFFSEPKRWAEHWRRIELEKMSLQKSEADMRLTVLQAQVEPHFLFNTLASVRSLVTSDPQRAAQTIDALSSHLRATLPKLRAETGVVQSTLGEQFAICASYLELMQVRLGDRLSVDIHLPKELRGVTRVALAARTLDSGGRKQLEVQVEDDGAGLKLGMGEGTGLANVRAQLLTRFAAAASLDLSERSGGGVLARLVLPFEPATA